MSATGEGVGRGGEPALWELLRAMTEMGASDLHLAAGQPPRVRLHGELVPMEGRPVLTGRALSALLREAASAGDWNEYEETGDLDFALGVDGVARFRANYFRQEHGPGAVFRIIPERIPALEELGAPPAVAELAHLHQGLVLVTGPTGSGKSTTLAAILDRINRTYAKHIVTIEDPVEFVHRPERCLISHREVGSDTDSFGNALRAAMRQDAEVILVGELRDLETIALAVTAAEMGSLVLATLHTSSAVKTIDRLIDVFPADEQAQVRVSLSESLAAVVSQLLLPTVDESGRVAVHEILLRARGLGNVIREGNTPMIESIIQAGRAAGMQTMDDSLMARVKEGVISAVEAHRKASDRERFESLLEAAD